MKINKSFSIVRIFAIVAMATALIFAGNAFAASNSVPETSSGDGQSPITGYTVSNVHYTLSDSDPTLVTAVSFDLSPDNGVSAPQTVRAQLVDGGSWFVCSSLDGNAWSCNVTATEVMTVDNLRIVAAQ
ncbi:MAG: hypothetical protein CVU41_16090 [Chloroflexi bacterium HGW-Chloroflexi-3]|nr:MAG: hypothetical protein CVU41_16090 [Chloroflexi bacterium HGW-Chloroflexi-3]